MSRDPYAAGTEGGDFNIFTLPTNLKMFAPTENGAVMFDVIPYKIISKHNWAISQGAKIGDEEVFANVFVHNNIGPNKRKVICPSKTFGGRCPICEHQQEMAKQHGWKHIEVKSLFPKQRLVFNLEVFDADGNKTHQLFDVAQFKGATPSFYDMVLAAADKVKLKKKLQNVRWADIATGMTIGASVQMKDEVAGEKTKKPFATLFNVSLGEREEQYTPTIFKTSIDPMSIAKVMTTAEIEKLFFAADSSEEDEDGEEEEVAEDNSDVHGLNNDPEPEVEPEPEPIVEAPKTIGVKPKPAVEATAAPKCPSGLRFAKDFSKDPACDDCDLFLDCRRAHKALT